MRVVVALALAVALAGPAAASAASRRPTAELSVRSATARLADGALVVDVVAVNRGRRRARASTSAVSWRPVQGRRVGRSVVLRRVRLAPVGRRASRRQRVRLAVPAGASGVYEVRVCLDVRGRVRERREHDNCRSAGSVAVPGAAVVPVASPGGPVRAPEAVPPGGATDPGSAPPPPAPDTTPPETTISSGPPLVSGLRVATFVFGTAERGSRLECRLDDADWAPCSSPVIYTSLAGGPHRFEVRATDAAGNVDPTPAVHDWTIDLVRPDVTITAGPSGDVATGDAELAFASTDVTATFECRVDLGAWAACTSPVALSALADGPHAFDVRAVDAALNVSSPFASQAWNVDTTAPDTAITSGPSGEVPYGDVQFAFASADTGATFECRTDAGEWQACTSPTTITLLPPGDHTFDVRAVDAVGNRDATPASGTWTLLPPPDPPTP